MQTSDRCRSLRSSERALAGLRWWMAVVLSVSALAVLPQAAHAQKPSKEELQTFKELVKESSALRDEGEYWQAREQLEEAREILDHPKLTNSIAELHQKTGACDKAKKEFISLLARSQLPDGMRAEAAESLENNDACTPLGTLSITCEPADAQVHIGSKALSCSTREQLSPGEVQIVVSAPGHADEQLTVALEAGELVERRVELRTEVDEPAVSEAPTPWKTYAAYGSMGVGGALLVGGLVSDLSAQSRADEFVEANRAGDRSRAISLKDEAESAQLRTIVLYSAGAVLAGGGVVLWAIDSSETGNEKPGIRAEFGWQTGGPSVRGVLHW